MDSIESPQLQNWRTLGEAYCHLRNMVEHVFAERDQEKTPGTKVREKLALNFGCETARDFLACHAGMDGKEKFESEDLTAGERLTLRTCQLAQVRGSGFGDVERQDA